MWIIFCRMWQHRDLPREASDGYRPEDGLIIRQESRLVVDWVLEYNVAPDDGDGVWQLIYCSNSSCLIVQTEIKTFKKSLPSHSLWSSENSVDLRNTLSLLIPSAPTLLLSTFLIALTKDSEPLITRTLSAWVNFITTVQCTTNQSTTVQCTTYQSTTVQCTTNQSTTVLTPSKLIQTTLAFFGEHFLKVSVVFSIRKGWHSIDAWMLKPWEKGVKKQTKLSLWANHSKVFANIVLW